MFADPDRFDITRDARNHVSFGNGRHMCAGMHLAQLEMKSILLAMIPRVRRIHLGTPVMAMNNLIHAFASLPARFDAEVRH